MQISISSQERFGKLWFFESLKTCQNLIYIASMQLYVKTAWLIIVTAVAK